MLYPDLLKVRGSSTPITNRIDWKFFYKSLSTQNIQFIFDWLETYDKTHYQIQFLLSLSSVSIMSLLTLSIRKFWLTLTSDAFSNISAVRICHSWAVKTWTWIWRRKFKLSQKSNCQKNFTPELIHFRYAFLCFCVYYALFMNKSTTTLEIKFEYLKY